MIPISLIQALNVDVCDLLWTLKGMSLSQAPGPFHPPYYRIGKQRISEQEARFSYAQILQSKYFSGGKTPFSYSVETPTQGKYHFSGDVKNARSAQIDMSLYNLLRSATPQCHIEFKCGVATEDAIAKDVEKLIGETILSDALGVFFHVMNACDASTMRQLSDKFMAAMPKAIAKGLTKWHDGYAAPTTIPLLFTFCFLNDKCSSQYQWAASHVYQVNVSTPDQFFGWMKASDPLHAARNAGWATVPQTV